MTVHTPPPPEDRLAKIALTVLTLAIIISFVFF